jgi:hypothetical protein
MSAITADVRTRMEGGVEQLEALVMSVERVDEALRANTPLTQAIEAWRKNATQLGDARARASKFPELAPLLHTLNTAEHALALHVTEALAELRIARPASLGEGLDTLAPHLPIVFRGALESSGLVFGGVALAALFGAASVISSWPWLAVAPIAAGIGGLLWDRARSRALLVSQQVLIVGSRLVRLADIEHIVVPRSMGAYRCKLDIHGGTYVELPAITPLLDILRGAGVEVRFE